MAHLEIVVENSADDLEYHKLRKEVGYFRCPRKSCHHSWKATIGQVIDDRACPKCGHHC
jgi:hypothetical protein